MRRHQPTSILVVQPFAESVNRASRGGKSPAGAAAPCLWRDTFHDDHRPVVILAPPTRMTLHLLVQ